MSRFFEKKKKLKIILLSVLLLLVLLVGGFYIYTLDYYRASEGVADIQALADAERIDNLTIFHPEDNANSVGIIFYPGGKVEAIAYAPILAQLKERGYTCVLVKMPMNLAVFDINAADKVYDKVSGIDEWYLMGHSLGGAMASSYTENNGDKLQGLILLGAYPLDKTEVPTLSIYGSEDNGIDFEKIDLSDEIVRIEGGNHAYFGNYGEQKGDGKASIERQTQQAMAVDAIQQFIQENK